MLPIHDLPVFLSAALLLNITPGSDMLYVAGTAASRGRAAGIAAALGVGVGCLVHVALGALGISALIVASEGAFTVLRLAGAAYLVWIGVGLWRRASAVAPLEALSAAPAGGGLAAVFRQGVWVNALNPKVALFFLALLPQFIVPSAGGQALAFVALGLLFDLGGTLVNLVVAVWVASARQRLGGRAGGAAGPWIRRISGSVFVALGLRLAFSGR